MKSKWNAMIITLSLVGCFFAGAAFGVACVQMYAKHHNEINISGEQFTKK
ncbi:MAG: hypothetical protein ACRDBQ_15030 [Shewanella sp.]